MHNVNTFSCKCSCEFIHCIWMCVCCCPCTQHPRAMNQGLGLHLWPPSFSKPDAVVQLRILGHSGKGAPADKCQNWSHPPLKETGSFIRPTGLCSLDCYVHTCTDLDWHNLVHNIWILSLVVFDKWCLTSACPLLVWKVLTWIMPFIIIGCSFFVQFFVLLERFWVASHT